MEARGPAVLDDPGLDIEAHLVDTKPYPTTARDTGRPRQPGEPVHDMWLRLTIDTRKHQPFSWVNVPYCADPTSSCP